MSIEQIKENVCFSLKSPKHGWLPVTFHYKDFKLDFSASDVLNDPLEELLNIITLLEKGETAKITFWLEPNAYFFEFEKRDNLIFFNVLETDDLNATIVKKKLLRAYLGNVNHVITPLRNALTSFCSLSYNDDDWPSRISKEQLKYKLQ